MYLNKITFKENILNFCKDEEIELKPVTIFVGANCIGKSTILYCIRSLFKTQNTVWTNIRLNKLKDKIIIDKVVKDFNVIAYDSDRDNASRSGHIEDGNIGTVQLMSMDYSTGQSNLTFLGERNITKAQKSLLILDEPERGLSVANVMSLCYVLRLGVFLGENQIIMATNNERVMESFESVCKECIYSIYHKKYLTFENFMKYEKNEFKKRYE